MKKVFEQAALGNLILRNRLVRSATWEGLAGPDGGIPEALLTQYEELARGGVGAVITGFTSVSSQDVYFSGMMRLSEDALIGQYRRLAEGVHAGGCPVVAQLALGAYYRAGVQTEPDGMTVEEIRRVEDWFIQAARRAQEAGFDGVQIHAAHFFFLSRFISPAVNHRRDEYGGSTENRARILRRILAGIRACAPGLHVSVKINCSDFTPGGLEEEESLAVCRLLDSSSVK